MLYFFLELFRHIVIVIQQVLEADRPPKLPNTSGEIQSSHDKSVVGPRADPKVEPLPGGFDEDASSLF